MNLATAYIHKLGVVCPLGGSTADTEKALFGHAIEPANFLRPSAWSNKSQLWEAAEAGQGVLPLGRIDVELPEVPVEGEHSRNNQLLTAAVKPLLDDIAELRTRFGAHRIGVVLGTSTSGISDGESAIAHRLVHGSLPESYHYRLQEPFAPARYLANLIGSSGPVWVESSACTSGAKALVSAARLLRLGVCDVVVAGGVDSLCRMTVAGFRSLGVTSQSLCQPFSRQRDGINIGEAAAIFILSRETADIALVGSGETSDAYHISAPDPEGKGAEAAMRQALQQAALTPKQLDYLNFHGTATLHNDRMEAMAAQRVFGAEFACGSTKSLTGHTLGAAGALEAAFCWMTLNREDGRLPAHCWSGELDPDLPELPGLAMSNVVGGVSTAMSNSFAFGGNNLSLILARRS